MTSDEISKIFNSTMQASPRIGTSSPQGVFSGYRRSLNREYRKKELQRISEENQAFLQRLQGTQAEIKAKRYEQDYRKKIPVLRNMCEFPYVLGDYKAS